MIFVISNFTPVNASIPHLKAEYGTWSENRFAYVLLPLLRRVVPLNFAKGRCARYALRHTFHIGMF